MSEPARPVDGRRERWNEHRTRRRAVLVDAGVAAIDRYGGGSSAEEIAATARVSRTVLYRYFRDTEDLRSAVSQRIGEIVIAQLQPPLRSGTTANQIIGGTLEALTDWVEAHPRLYEFLRRRGTTLGNVEATIADQLAELLSGFMGAFGLRTTLAEPAAQSLIGMVEHTLAWWMKSRTISRRDLVEHLRHAVWNVIDGELRRANIAFGLDDALPFVAGRR
jgi:AcrR family transcriptional regulator